MSADLRKGHSVKKRLSDRTLKEYTAKVSKQFKLSFDSETEKLRFDFLLNDRNGDVYRSESVQHKHLLSKVHMRKQEIIQAYSLQRICDSVLVSTTLDYTGHTAEINWQCEKGHIVNWTSSTEQFCVKNPLGVPSNLDIISLRFSR